MEDDCHISHTHKDRRVKMFEEFIAKIKKNRKMDAKTINGELVQSYPISLLDQL